MFEVRLYEDANDKQGIMIHSPYTSDIKLSSGNVKQLTKEIWQFSFSINPYNRGWGKIKPLQSLIRVFNHKTGNQEFAGRVLRITQVMNVDGMITIRYECESFLAYLQDSSQRHGEYRNITPRDFLQVIIDNHNSQVEPHKRMKLGDVTVTTSTDNVYRYLGYDRTLDTIKDKLIDRLGGYLRLREEEDGLYLDYLESVGEVSSTEIRLRRNLKDMQRDIDPRDVITRVVPLGTRIESEDEEAVDASQARLTIADVNNGIDYLDIPEFQEEFGIIEGSIIFDDVTVPGILKTRGEQFIQSQHAALVKYNVNPVDLFLIDEDMDSFHVDNYHRVVNELFGIDEILQVVQKNINIMDPTDISLVIGDMPKTLTDYQVELNKSASKVVDLENTVSRQSQRLGQLVGEISNVNKEITNVQQLINNVDLEHLPDAIQSLEQAISNLNDALDGIPIYDVATPTKDGLMAAADKVKLDALQVYEEATELQAGLMSASDKAKLNRITVTQNINLDNLLARIEALENPQDQ